MELQFSPLCVSVMGNAMHKNSKINFEAMSLDELWALHDEMGKLLATKITQEKEKLERQLATVTGFNFRAKETKAERRPYPQVYPKYRNPADSTETWTGRGKQPKWLRAQLISGKKLSDFAIDKL